jgi:AcrR family transcriptional regulator
MTAGLRERKRQRTHEAISEAAIALFLARGFDAVSVADVAAAAEVSKPTLFKYFATKEDLVLHRILDHRGEAARVVRDRPAGVDPLDALHRHFIDGLAARDPLTGLNDNPAVLAYHRLVFDTPSLGARLAGFVADDEEALAEALAAGGRGVTLRHRLAAAQVVAVQRILARDTWRQLVEGRPARRVHARAVAAADEAFAMLRSGLAPL